MASRANDLLARIRRYLAIEGPSTSTAIATAMGISQPTFSRLVARHRDEMVTAGRGPATRYAARRSIGGVGDRIPVYEIDERGAASRLAILHPLFDRGFYAESDEATAAGFYEDLPYYLADLRPSGFLGRLIPARHPELRLPADLRSWSTDDTMRYLSHAGSNAPGSCVVGDEAFQLRLAEASRPKVVARKDRGRVYPRLADDVLGTGAPGSSAAGEQPKFLAIREEGPANVLVKFTGPVGEGAGRRWADLLVSEHLVHETLRRIGRVAALSELVEADGRVFLEVERFDRVGIHGRRGVISLSALDAEFTGKGSGWTSIARGLADLGRINEATRAQVEWLENFGRLIANTDMHPGNLSFMARRAALEGLAPTYDMLPMMYAPLQGQIVGRVFETPIPSPKAAGYWDEVCSAAATVWTGLATHPLVSRSFKAIAAENAGVVDRARALGALLPR